MAIATENIFESFFRNSVEGILIFDKTGKIADINPAAKEFFGIGINADNPKNVKDLIGIKYHEELWDICNRLLDHTEKKGTGNTLVIHNEGNREKNLILGLHLNNHIKLQENRYIAAFVTDETGRWKEKHELRQSHERFRKIFKYNPVAQLIIRESDSHIIDANNKFLNLFGYELDEVIGKDTASIGLDHCKECKVKISEAPDEHHIDNDCEYEAQIKSGKVINLLQSYVLIKLHDVTHEIWSLADITEQKAAEGELKRSNEELEKKVTERTKDLANLLEREKRMNELKSRFVATASHEFRTPLTTILASAGLVETYARRMDTEKCLKHIDRIKASVELLTEILEDFLSLDKIEQGNVKPNITSFNLEDFAGNVMREAESTLKKGQSIEYSLTGDMIIKQDHNILKNTMLNLLSNAIKYSGEGANISWDISAQRDKTIITVADNGIGIPFDDQPYIFSRFFRARNAETIQGTGLGLNIVKKYIELLHGKISFVSAENAGTSFILDLPAIS